MMHEVFAFSLKSVRGKSIFFPVMRSVLSNLAANHSAAVKQGLDRAHYMNLDLI